MSITESFHQYLKCDILKAASFMLSRTMLFMQSKIVLQLAPKCGRLMKLYWIASNKYVNELRR